LRLDRVLGRSKERFDTQILLDPFGEQLNMRALFVKWANSQRRKRHIVRQKPQCLAGLHVDVSHLPNQLYRL